MVSLETYDNLENTLKNEEISCLFTGSDCQEKDADKYLAFFANLSYFVDEKGEFLYKRDEKTGQFKGLDYEKIIKKTSELMKYDSQGSFDEAETKKNIDELYQKTSKAFSNLKLMKDFGNYYLSPGEYGSGEILTDFPVADMALEMLANSSIIEKLIPKGYLSNALKSIEKKMPENYGAIMELIGKKEDSWFNAFLNTSKLALKRINVSSKTAISSLNDWLYGKTMIFASAFDNFDKEHCKQEYLNNDFFRVTDSIVRAVLSCVVYQEGEKQILSSAFEKYATEDMKESLSKLLKKH